MLLYDRTDQRPAGMLEEVERLPDESLGLARLREQESMERREEPTEPKELSPDAHERKMAEPPSF